MFVVQWTGAYGAYAAAGWGQADGGYGLYKFLFIFNFSDNSVIVPVSLTVSFVRALANPGYPESKGRKTVVHLVIIQYILILFNLYISVWQHCSILLEWLSDFLALVPTSLYHAQH